MRPVQPALSSNYNYPALHKIRITGISEHIQLHIFFVHPGFSFQRGKEISH